jgi:hypothetical protein
VSGGSTAVEQPGRSQDAGAGAHRGDPPRLAGKPAHVGDDAAVLHRVDEADATDDDQGVQRPDDALQGLLGLQGQSRPGVDRRPTRRGEGDLVHRRAVHEVRHLQS